MVVVAVGMIMSRFLSDSKCNLAHAPNSGQVFHDQRFACSDMWSASVCTRASNSANLTCLKRIGGHSGSLKLKYGGGGRTNQSAVLFIGGEYVRFLFAYALESLPMETKLHVFVCQTFAHHSYPEFDQKLPELRAIPLMHSIWAARTVLTAKELKDALRKTLDDSDRILVVEVSAGWAKPASGKQSGRFTSTPRGYGSRTVEAGWGE